MSILIRPMAEGEHAACDEILRSLPAWFGIEEALVDYVRAVQTMETWIAESSGAPIGFLTLDRHNEFSAEIHVLAVVERLHGQGCGSRLVQHAEAVLRARSAAARITFCC